MATQRKYVYEDFTTQQPTPAFSAAGAIVTAADTQVDHFRTDRGNRFELYQDGANTALVADRHAAATGMLFPGDNAAEALEMTQGILATQNNMAFTVGTDSAFFLQTVWKIGTIARTTALLTGFRKQGSYVTIKAANAATALAAHTDKAMIGIASVAALNVTQTSLNGTDLQTSLTKTAATNDDYIALRVNVSSAGVVTYTIGVSTTTAALAVADLAADASAVAFTFDDAEVVIPCLQRIGTASTDVSDTYLVSYECGIA